MSVNPGDFFMTGAVVSTFDLGPGGGTGDGMPVSGDSNWSGGGDNGDNGERPPVNDVVSGIDVYGNKF